MIFWWGKAASTSFGFQTQKLLKRRSCGGELPAAHWCIVAIGIAIFELSGIFFVLPCVENYTKVDLRTSAIDIPPQEVCFMYDQKYYIYLQLTTTTMLNRDQLDQRKWKKRNSRQAKWIVLVLFNYYLILECSHTTPNRAATGVSDITRWLTPLTLTELTRRQWWQWWQ